MMVVNFCLAEHDVIVAVSSIEELCVCFASVSEELLSFLVSNNSTYQG
jgi:hypothetical protein